MAVMDIMWDVLALGARIGEHSSCLTGSHNPGGSRVHVVCGRQSVWAPRGPRSAWGEHGRLLGNDFFSHQSRFGTLKLIYFLPELL